MNNQNLPIQTQNDNNMNIFQDIQSNELLTKNNTLYNTIHSETKNISLFLKDSIETFHYYLKMKK